MSPTANGQEHKFKDGGEAIGAAIPQVPVTEERLPFMQVDDHGYLQQAGMFCLIRIEVEF